MLFVTTPNGSRFVRRMHKENTEKEWAKKPVQPCLA
jgi:hypothetical protein